MLPIDADIVFEFDARCQKSDITFKAYFQHPSFERPPEQRRVVLHVLVTESDGLKRSVSLPLQALMVGWGDVAEGDQGYGHSISFFDEEGSHVKQSYYAGIPPEIGLNGWRSTFRKSVQEATSVGPRQNRAGEFAGAAPDRAE